MGEPNPGRRDNAGESTLIIGLCDNMREEYGRLFVDIPWLESNSVEQAL